LKGLCKQLSNRYPVYQKELEARLSRMLAELERADLTIRKERATLSYPAVITLHDAFVYFLRHYQIEFIGSVQPSASKDPTPRQLKHLADAILSKHIKAIFIEPKMNPQPADVLAKELQLRVLKYDDLGSTTGAKTISEYLLWNWHAFQPGF
jgi:zinc transport system substrate-binding protein